MPKFIKYFKDRVDFIVIIWFSPPPQSPPPTAPAKTAQSASPPICSPPATPPRAGIAILRSCLR